MLVAFAPASATKVLGRRTIHPCLLFDSAGSDPPFRSTMPIDRKLERQPKANTRRGIELNSTMFHFIECAYFRKKHGWKKKIEIVCFNVRQLHISTPRRRGNANLSSLRPFLSLLSSSFGKGPDASSNFCTGKKRTNTEKFSLKEAPCSPAGIHSKALFAFCFLFDLTRIRF